MFENIIGQDGTVGELQRGIDAGTLPAGLLFHGPRYSGKLTTALELARILTCDGPDAAWDCGCDSCERQRRLLHPYTLLMGTRRFTEEIRASADVLVRNDRPAARYLFIRSVRKLLRRFDPVLWERSGRKAGTVASHVESVSEALEAFDPDKDLPAAEQVKKLTETIIEGCGKIESAAASDNIPIDQIRSVSYWAHTTTQSSRKVVIMENTDRLVAGSRNALLKILEEPPPDTYFVLITRRKEAIISTVRSRLRHYAFRERSAAETQEVLLRVFREESGEYSSINEYFLAWNLNPEVIRTECRRFMESVVRGQPSPVFSSESGELRGLAKTKRTFAAFLEELNGLCRTLLHSDDGRFGAGRLCKWVELVRSKQAQMEQLNINAEVLLESLYFEMREV